jgi:hypothetical protein
VLLARCICLLLSGAGSGYLSADVRAWSQYFAMPPPLMSILNPPTKYPLMPMLLVPIAPLREYEVSVAAATTWSRMN